MINLHDLLTFAVERNASDLHLSAGLTPMIRVDGELLPLSTNILDNNDLSEKLLSILSPDQHEKFLRDLEIDFSFSIDQSARFRVNIFRQLRGISAVFRIIPNTLFSLQELGAPDTFKKLCHLSHGLVLITGSTGSGKSTTMAAMLDYINTHFNKHIITIENPIEYIHQSKNCMINQREVGEHTHNAHFALRSALREDPDIIMIGEMRDIETIRLALTAAETGHLVFSTVHTNSAAETIDRLINVFPSDEQNFIRSMLSLSLQAVISQVLLKKKNGGRIAAFEIMLANTAIRNLIRENKIYQMMSVIQTCQIEGMITRENFIKQLMSRGVVL